MLQKNYTMNKFAIFTVACVDKGSSKAADPASIPKSAAALYPP